MSTNSRAEELDFIAKAKDGVYKAAEIIREEATATERTAQAVEKLSKIVEDDVDNAESLVHQVITTTNSTEKKRIEAEVSSNGSSSKAPNKMGNVLGKDDLAVKWRETTFHILFILLTLFAVLLHNYNWGSSIFGKNFEKPDDGTTLPTSKNYTFFSLLLVYMGTIWKALRFLMNWQKSTVIKVEEKVHEIGKEVKSVANNIEEAANTVEHISQHVEEEATQIQSIINPVKST